LKHFKHNGLSIYQTK